MQIREGADFHAQCEDMEKEYAAGNYVSVRRGF